jgi:hypothetical protein
VEYIFAGFRQDANIRRFVFHTIVSKTRTEYTVGADLVLIQRYQIALQELPLLCRRVLENHPDPAGERTFMFTEDDMRQYAKGRAAARELALQQKRRIRPPVSANVGAAWRGPRR